MCLAIVSTRDSKAPAHTLQLGPHSLGIAYHDAEWGVPVHDDTTLFEFLTLEGAQAGLSWETILKKREAYRAAFWTSIPRGWHGSHQCGSNGCFRTPGSFAIGSRSRARSVTRAHTSRFRRSSAASMPTFGASSTELRWTTPEFTEDIPARTAESDALSRDLLRRGFKFVGSTICYAFMQAVGLVNDHTTDCFRHALVGRIARRRTSSQ